MNNMLGIVSSIPYNYTEVNGSVTSIFKIQVDRKHYIKGEITVKITSSSAINLCIGTKIEVSGSTYIEWGVIFIATSFVKIPF